MRPQLIVCRHCIHEVANSLDVADMYTTCKNSHHYNYSVVVLTQNMFAEGKHFRTISLNTHFLWILKSVRDNTTVQTLGARMGQKKFLFDCYTDAMKTSYSHLFVNLQLAEDENTRIRSKMFDSPSVFYVPRK